MKKLKLNILLMMQKKNIIQWSAYLVIYNIISFLCTFLSANLFTNWFTPDEYAIIGKLTFLTTLGVGVFGNWTNFAINKYVPEYIALKKDTYPFCLFVGKIFFVSMIILSILCLIFKEQIYTYIGLKTLMPILLILLFNSFFITLMMILNALSKFGETSILRSLERVFYLAMAFIICKVLLSKDPLVFLNFTLAKGIITVALTLVVIYFSKNIYPFFKPGKERLSKNENFEILKISFPYLVTIIVFNISSWFDFFIVSTTQSKLDTGLYFLAVQINNILMLGVMIPTTVLTPKIIRYLTEGKNEAIDEYTNTLMPFAQLMWALALCLVMALSKYIIGIFFSSKFDGANIYIQIITLGNAGAMITQLFVPIVTFYKETKKFLYAQVIIVLINIVLTFFLIEHYQTLGIAAAKAVSIFCYPFVLYLLFPNLRKYYQPRVLVSFLFPIITFGILRYLKLM